MKFLIMFVLFTGFFTSAFAQSIEITKLSSLKLAGDYFEKNYHVPDRLLN